MIDYWTSHPFIWHWSLEHLLAFGRVVWEPYGEEILRGREMRIVLLFAIATKIGNKGTNNKSFIIVVMMLTMDRRWMIIPWMGYRLSVRHPWAWHLE